MTDVNWREVGVGAIATALVILVIGFIAFPSTPETPPLEGGYRVEADFGRIDGLAVGSPVRMAGLNIGAVEKVDLASGNRAAVVMAISTVDMQIPADSAAVIETDGVFGQKYVEIHPGGDFEMIPDGGRLSYSQDSVVLESLLNQIVSRAKAAQDALDTEEALP